MSDFEDRLREIAREISRTVERNIDDVAEAFGVDADRARHFAESAGQWLNDHVESSGDELFGRQADAAPSADRAAPSRNEPVPSRPGPHPLDLPTAPQGLALSALDSGRWTVRPGSNTLSSSGEGPAPVDAAGLVSELRARDWIKADGELTLVGRRALDRWYDTAQRPAPHERLAAPDSPPAADEPPPIP